MTTATTKRQAVLCPACGSAVGPRHGKGCPVAQAAAAHTEIESAKVRRGTAVRKARAQGVSQGMIAEAVGCSKRLVQLMEKDGAK